MQPTDNTRPAISPAPPAGGVQAPALRHRVRGPVITPADAGYDNARRAWNLTVDQHPALIVVAHDREDIVEAVRYAGEAGLGIAVLSTGHGVVRPADGDALLIVTSQMNAVRIDVPRRTAWIEAGARWGRVLEEAQAVGLAPLLGSSPDVGAVGYTLGGGMGWLARRHGLALDSVVAFDVVTADGRVIRASEDENADLFWGLRGGGGSLGVIAAMEVRLVQVAAVYGGNLYYPAEEAREVIRRYRDWVVNVPEELTSSFALMNFPPIPELPEPLRGNSFAIIRGCYCGPAAEGEALLAHWRGWRRPLIDDFKEMPFSAVGAISSDPVDPIAGISTGAWLRELDDEVIDHLVRHTVPKDGPPLITFTEVRHAGGAIARVPAGSAAYGHRDASHIMQIVAILPTAEARIPVMAHIGRLQQALQPHLTGGVYLNFLEGEESRARIRDGYSPETFARLRSLKAKYDPRNRLRYGFHIPPAWTPEG